MQKLATLSQPPFIDETQHWFSTYSGAGGDFGEDHVQRTLFDSETRRECILSVPFGHNDRPIVGPSYFAPDLWLIHKPADVQPDARNLRPDLSDLSLKQIGNVSVVARSAYDITLAGIDKLTNGGSAYHLSLRPRSDPLRHNLRDLWINTENGDINRAGLLGEYSPNNRDPLQETLVLENFGEVGGYWLMIEHVWTYRHSLSSYVSKYDAVSVSMVFPQFIPSWYFNSAAFDQHRSEVNMTSTWPTPPPNP